MALAEHEQHAWLLSCLTASLDSTNSEIRKQAEQALSDASLREGYGVALANIVLNTNLTLGLRQLAAVLLKLYVNQHWSDDEKDYVPPMVNPQDKARIRGLLLPVLGDPHGKIRTAVGMAISRIATSDWPEEWPDLMNYILECINDRNNMNRMRGALRCLAMFSGELDDKQVPLLVPVLFPSLYAIVSQPSTYDSSMRKAALATLHSCMATLGIMMSPDDLKNTKNHISPMLRAWMEQFAAILASPVQPEDPDDWGVRMEVLKALIQIVQNFAKLAFQEFSVVMQPLWQTVVTGLQVYQEAAVKGDQEVFAGLANSDGSDQSLEALMIQLFELLQTLVGSARYQKVIKGNIKDLAYYTIGYMQMTEEQVARWSEDPNQYVADEEDPGASCRTSGITLLEAIVESHENSVVFILEAVTKRIEEAEIARANSQADWWKLREAAIYALGPVAEMPEQSANVKHFLDGVLSTDLSRGYHASPLLYGRALWGASKLSTFLSNETRQKFLVAAVEGLSLDVAPIVVGSLRALSVLISNVDRHFYEHLVDAMLSSLSHLLQKATEDTSFLIMESLCSVLKATQSPAAESMISPLVLDIWIRNFQDPLIGIQALETLEVIKDIPGCIQPFKGRVLPVLAGILAQPENQPEGLIAPAIDVVTVLLKNAPLEVIEDIYKATFASVINITLHSSDSSELQNATEALSSFVKNGGENVLTWSADPNWAMKMLLQAAARILHPSTDSSGAFFVGSFILQLIQHLSNHMAPHLRELVAALIIRFENVRLRGSLILVFARLVHMSAPNYGQFIDLLSSIPAQNYDNALTALMSEWTKSQGEISGDYHIKVCVTALASLLSSGHPALSRINVQGRLVQPVQGVMTRSRKKVQPDHYTTVPLPEKIFSLLAETLAECYEVHSFPQEGDWDEDSDEEGDPSGVFKYAENYKHLLNEDVDDFDDGIEDSFEQADPISKINLQEYLENFMKNCAPRAPPSFLQALSDREKAAVEAALKR